MIDIVERLRFDAVRCEMQFSKGVAGNIEEAAKEIERLRVFANWNEAIEASAKLVENYGPYNEDKAAKIRALKDQQLKP